MCEEISGCSLGETVVEAEVRSGYLPAEEESLRVLEANYLNSDSEHPKNNR
jgi:hypothetical protein